MTDLLRLLSDLHDTVAGLGELHIMITNVEGYDGVTDRRTGTIHVNPGLGLVRSLVVIADGVAALTSPGVVDSGAQVAVGAEDVPAAMPPDRHLRVVQ